ncbi:hypothetical protein E6W39_37410 [Kitasatospora acidiphila]|uniref:Uncharacterized protein n=1 Tax=Kitasatospora acidiphila TaxID=2567942 RepID=A0A540WD07_9ACTN|nr:hypothetical protein [Kitasatospora acidiphila]TQF06832.1 hypothetical protein E6W39_37410 [Kitasatospora acidiphila]
MTTTVPGGRAAARPGRVLLGFVLLLVLLFGASYAAGRLVGPSGSGPGRGPATTDVPGMHMDGLRLPAGEGVAR